MRRFWEAALILLLFAAVIIASLLWGSLTDQSLALIQQAGVIRIGYAIEAPYAFLKPDGEVTGESPEVAKRVAAGLGIAKIEWRQTEFSNLIPELESNRIDLIAAGMFITPERAERVCFSEPTFHVHQGLLVASGNPLRLHSYKQLAGSREARIAVISGAIEESLLRRLGLPQDSLVAVPDALTGRVAVESGLADGLALSSTTVRWMALRQQLGKTEVAQPFEDSGPPGEERLGYGAFAFRKRDRQLLAAWNGVLQTLTGTDEHLRIVSQFGFTQAEMPGTIAALEVLRR